MLEGEGVLRVAIHPRIGEVEGVVARPPAGFVEVHAPLHAHGDPGRLGHAGAEVHADGMLEQHHRNARRPVDDERSGEHDQKEAQTALAQQHDGPCEHKGDEHEHKGRLDGERDGADETRHPEGSPPTTWGVLAAHGVDVQGKHERDQAQTNDVAIHECSRQRQRQKRVRVE